MKNKNLKKLFRKNKNKKTVYRLSQILGISPQAGDYIVKQKDLTKDYMRLKKIADYFEVSIEEIVDLKRK